MQAIISDPNWPYFVVLGSILIVLVVWTVLDIKYANITVGLCQHADDSTSHGKVFLQGTEGHHVVQFIVNNPQKLILPTKQVLISIFDQIVKIGFEPISIEIHYGVNRSVYYKDQFTPVLVQPL